MSIPFMKTIGAIRSIRQEEDALHIELHRIVDVTNFIKLCFSVNGIDETVASAIHEYTKRENITFSSTIFRIRNMLRMVIPLSSKNLVSVVEFYDENNRNTSKKFHLN